MLADSISHGAAKTEEELRREICTAGRWIRDRGYVVSTEGNISVRLDSDRVLTSPTCISKGLMSPEDLVIVDLEGRKLAGHRQPSSELGMHLLFYRRRPDVNAVCHAHPPVATGYAAAGIPLDKPCLAEIALSLGCVPLAPYGTPGTPELSSALEPLVQNYDAILMANHGVVTCGADLLTAFFNMETVEHFARVLLVAELLGKQTLLSSGDIDKLLEARARYTAAAASSRDGAATDGGNESTRNGTDRISMTREELEALIEEAVRKDRARR